ncbi:hypothetical protein BD410DRAFT_745243 [Rickenella mellea]|uniref:Uncharacterized protein n=1 Tax=Rickenella mellea TaxID=50990 RepID=A0A4Y7QA92_9AGAM|nr:hypothetical protein BD410DRAFT_745243 [Rickenella mellea]
MPDFDLSTATTRNHVYVNKTLRYPYYQTMSHQPMHINDWIEIDKDLKWYIDEKARVIREKGKHVVDSLPENDDACGELMEILVQYLPKRYPTLFERLDCEGGGIWNKVTQERLTGLEGKKGVDALLACSRLVEDDFLMARERDDGQVYFTGGLVAFPGFYLLSDKLNKSVREIHQPVPYFNEKLSLSVERTLKRFKPDEPFERTSWGIVDDSDLHWHNIATHDASVPEKLHPKDLFFRVDHQTFRKLPRTRGIIFGVHPIMKRLEDFEDSPLIPELLIKIHEHSDEVLINYKLGPKYQDKMIPYLRGLTARQIERGLINGTEDVAKFREMIKEGQEYPSSQTSLSVPTESEINLSMQ